VRWVTGRDYLADIVRLFVGDRPASAPNQPLRGAAYHFLMPPAGMLDHVSGLDEVRRMPDVLDAEVLVAAGEPIAPVRVGTDRAGFIITGASTRDAAWRAALDAESRLQFVTR
jgi:cysteine synthase A